MSNYTIGEDATDAAEDIVEGFATLLSAYGGPGSHEVTEGRKQLKDGIRAALVLLAPREE